MRDIAGIHFLLLNNQLIATSFGAALAGLITNLGGITNPGGVIGAVNASFYLYAIFTLAPLVAIFILILSKRNRS